MSEPHTRVAVLVTFLRLARAPMEIGRAHDALPISTPKWPRSSTNSSPPSDPPP